MWNRARRRSRSAIAGAFVVFVFTGLTTMGYGAPAGATSLDVGAGSAFSQSLTTGTPSDPWIVAPITLSGVFPIGSTTSPGQITLSSMSFYWWTACPLSTTTGTPACPVNPTFSGALISGSPVSGTCSGVFEQDASGVFDFAVPLACQGIAGSQTVVSLTLNIQLDAPDAYGGPLAGIYTATGG